MSVGTGFAPLSAGVSHPHWATRNGSLNKTCLATRHKNVKLVAGDVTGESRSRQVLRSQLLLVIDQKKSPAGALSQLVPSEPEHGSILNHTHVNDDLDSSGENDQLLLLQTQQAKNLSYASRIMLWSALGTEASVSAPMSTSCFRSCYSACSKKC